MTYKQTEKHTSRCRQIDRQTNIEKGRNDDRHLVKQRDRHTGQTDTYRQLNKQRMLERREETQSWLTTNSRA